MKSVRKLFLFICLLPCTTLLAQRPDTLTKLIPLIQRGENDSVRFTANQLFRLGVKSLLETDRDYITDSLKNISVITPPDKSFTLYTWLLPEYEGDRYHYFGFMTMKDPKTARDTIITLSDSTSAIQKPQSERLTPSRWLGCVYYEIVQVKRKGKTYYTLLGWKGKDRTSTQKIVDILHFDNGIPKFGLPVIKIKSVFRSRLIFTFTSQAVMTLSWEKRKKRIVFDHLTSPPGEGEDDILKTGPSGRYDALRLKRGRWYLQQDIDARIN